MIDLYTLSTEESGKLKDWLRRTPCIVNFNHFSCTILYTPFFSGQTLVFDHDAGFKRRVVRALDLYVYRPGKLA